ncbi:MAG TPA: hypothetical protein PK055_03930 [Gammaproteobacteria bacterium]|nr:hypothetical protein [Xanthomonadales bacterium]MCB1594650.1 hypothetical protein [Xanthomonadales bacterium]HPI95520.1 hypothetical protein [Gammaproteobacteria bacterium]HPQ86789.1 hypothetical protein [Gammaproteobacteria bacterium]
MSIESILKFTSGALAPTVAVLAVYIAFRQYLVERRNTKIALFDRRFDVYQKSIKYVFECWQSDNVPLEIEAQFRAAVVEAQFLFGSDVCDALLEVQRRGIEISVADRMRRQTSLEEEMQYVYTMRDHQQWFTRAEPHLSSVFDNI